MDPREQQRKQQETKHKVKLWLMEGNNLNDCIEGKYNKGIELFDRTTEHGWGLCVEGPKADIIIMDMADCITLHGGPINCCCKIPFTAIEGKWFKLFTAIEGKWFKFIG